MRPDEEGGSCSFLPLTPAVERGGRKHGFALFSFRPDTPTIRPLAVRQQRRGNLSAPPKQPLPTCFPFIRRPPCGALVDP